MMPEIRIPVFSTLRQVTELEGEIRAAMERVMASGWFILGEEVRAFEREFARFCEAREAVGVGNGTDAIELALRAVGVAAGDEVITVAHTAPFTGLAVLAIGATPVFVDVEEETMLMNPAGIEAALSPATKAILPVSLYGQACDVDRIESLAEGTGVRVVVDAAQAHGASSGGSRRAALGGGPEGPVAAFSFYPTKNLGAYGDGGAVVTDDPEVAESVRRWRGGGMGKAYRSDGQGRNSRLDELQAAILRVKLPYLERWNERRHAIAARYGEGLETVRTPADGTGRVYHLYVIRTPERDALKTHLAERGIGSAIHYPWPLHRQGAFEGRCRVVGTLDNTERCCAEVLSLPLYPEMTDGEVEEVIVAVNEFGGS
jgi:dTDP-4-amino-4,6-dideoxygalactose transaminase